MDTRLGYRLLHLLAFSVQVVERWNWLCALDGHASGPAVCSCSPMVLCTHDGQPVLPALSAMPQVCATTALERPHAPDPAQLYSTLRRLNPAPYAAWLRLGGPEGEAWGWARG